MPAINREALELALDMVSKIMATKVGDEVSFPFKSGEMVLRRVK